MISVFTQSPHRWRSYKPSAKRSLLSIRHAATIQATQHHHSLATTKLYCLVCVKNSLPKVTMYKFSVASHDHYTFMLYCT